MVYFGGIFYVYFRKCISWVNKVIGFEMDWVGCEEFFFVFIVFFNFKFFWCDFYLSIVVFFYVGFYYSKCLGVECCFDRELFWFCVMGSFIDEDLKIWIGNFVLYRCDFVGWLEEYNWMLDMF